LSSTAIVRHDTKKENSCIPVQNGKKPNTALTVRASALPQQIPAPLPLVQLFKLSAASWIALELLLNLIQLLDGVHYSKGTSSIPDIQGENCAS